MNKIVFLISLVLNNYYLNDYSKSEIKYESKRLKVISINDNLFVHISYLNLTNVGKFPCNGLVYKNGNQAIVFDSPTSDSASLELINWIEINLNCKIKAIVVNHFHVDCLGGLEAFHHKKIPSFAHYKTKKLAKLKNKIIPQNTFRKRQKIKIGNQEIINEYFGEAHSSDNIISYIPSENAIFGGCMVKSVNAKKGNLKDANVNKWANTIKKIKAKYPNLKIVVPGHGRYGNIELLDYTIKLFSKK